MGIRAGVVLLVLFGVAGTTGCVGVVPIPRSTQEQGIRPRIRSNQLEFIQPGVTIRREVALRLGEPDGTYQLGNSYTCYAIGAAKWDMHWWYYIPCWPRNISASGVSRDEWKDYLLIRFDRSGAVQKYRFDSLYNSRSPKQPFRSVVDLLQEWEKEEP